jgi:hypothetical protein
MLSLKGDLEGAEGTFSPRLTGRAASRRTSSSLARLWQSQGERQEAYELLAPVYDWFTEGFDTADLLEAKALPGELA